MRVVTGDCLDILPTLDENSIDSCITDPPYGITFMGSEWDHGIPGVRFWKEVYRVLKPGAHLLAFGGPRTHHRLMVAIEDAGFELRDCIMWLYGSGFPKSLSIDKAIDKILGAERDVIGEYSAAKQKGSAVWNGNDRTGGKGSGYKETAAVTRPATKEAVEWEGWGTALKPAWEIVIAAAKPLPEVEEQGIIVGNLLQLEAQLWLLLHASTAESDSTSSQAELDEALSIAQWTADKSTNTRDALRGQMDMSQFASAIATSLSTVSSWRSILEESLNPGNTSTISTESRTIIDWKTLSFLLSGTTPESIIQAEIQAPGSRLSALPVGAYLNAVAARQSATHTLSAIENVTSEARTLRRDVAGKELAPNWEPIIVAMKPLDGTFAQNALTHGVSGVWIEGGRVPTNGEPITTSGRDDAKHGKSNSLGDSWSGKVDTSARYGRWPANLILDEEAGRLLDNQAGQNVSRFFYCPKASKKERNLGLSNIPDKQVRTTYDKSVRDMRGNDSGYSRKNHHPTVKPIALMRYLCRLTKTPTGGIVLDPFAGSGSTGVAAVLEGREFIGIELEEDYAEIARLRIDHALTYGE